MPKIQSTRGDRNYFNLNPKRIGLLNQTSNKLPYFHKTPMKLEIESIRENKRHFNKKNPKRQISQNNFLQSFPLSQNP